MRLGTLCQYTVCVLKSFHRTNFRVSNFSLNFFIFLRWLAIQTKKYYFRKLYLKSLNQRYNKKHVTFLSQIKHWTHYRTRLLANNLFHSYFSLYISTIRWLFSQYLVNTAYNTLSILLLEGNSVLVDLEHILKKLRFILLMF